MSRLFKFGAALLVSCAAIGITQCAVDASPTPWTVSRNIQCFFDPDGFFYVRGAAPKGFEDFDHIELLVTNRGELKRTVADSKLYKRDGKTFKFTKLTRSGAHSSGWGFVFEFETEMIDGVSYKFSGRFLGICVFAEEETDPKRPVAEGRITKLIDGKEMATAEVQFTYSKTQRPRA